MGATWLRYNNYLACLAYAVACHSNMVPWLYISQVLGAQVTIAPSRPITTTAETALPPAMSHLHVRVQLVKLGTKQRQIMAIMMRLSMDAKHALTSYLGSFLECWGGRAEPELPIAEAASSSHPCNISQSAHGCFTRHTSTHLMQHHHSQHIWQYVLRQAMNTSCQSTISALNRPLEKSIRINIWRFCVGWPL